MRRNLLVCAVVFLGALVCSCSSQPTATTDAPLPRATVKLRDGSKVAGQVKASSPTEITLVADDQSSHTYPMSQVKSIVYADAAPAAAPAAAKSSTGTVTPAAAQSQEAHDDHYHPAEGEIRTKTYRLPVGAEVSVRTEDTIDSSKAAEGQTYAAEITDDVQDSDGNVVIPRGSNAQIIIRSASKGNRFHGQSDLLLDLQSVSVDGQEFLVSTTDLMQKGKQGIGANKRTAEYTGGGAVVGTIIGAIAGHGKGAAIGAGAGAGAGALTQVLTKGGAIKLPAETVLTFKLDKAVQVVRAQ